MPLISDPMEGHVDVSCGCVIQPAMFGFLSDRGGWLTQNKQRFRWECVLPGNRNRKARDLEKSR